jgi:hypothetical protein
MRHAPSIFAFNKVRCLKNMPAKTMGLTGILCTWPSATQDILTLRNQFQMRQIYASRIAAEMVNNESFWDRTVLCFKYHSMNKQSLTGNGPIA